MAGGRAAYDLDATVRALPVLVIGVAVAIVAHERPAPLVIGDTLFRTAVLDAHAFEFCTGGVAAPSGVLPEFRAYQLQDTRTTLVLCFVTSNAKVMSTKVPNQDVKMADENVISVLRECDRPVMTAPEIAESLGVSQQHAHRELQDMHKRRIIGKKKVGGRAVVWWLLDESKNVSQN